MTQQCKIVGKGSYTGDIRQAGLVKAVSAAFESIGTLHVIDVHQEPAAIVMGFQVGEEVAGKGVPLVTSTILLEELIRHGDDIAGLILRKLHEARRVLETVSREEAPA